ncbi:MAG: hypothetical protein FJ304_17780 [Planctomycetes bacterium]|nr:hypothetical protein [Planctomycetota bacterium]
MSTEQQPATPPAAPTPQGGAPANPSHNEAKQEPTALAKGLKTGWDKFKRGELMGYKWMALILLLVAGVGTTWWIISARRGAESAKWTEWDGLSSPESLKKFIEENPKAYQARLARLEIARMNLGQEGLDQMYGPQPSQFADDATVKKVRDARAAAVKNVEKARDEFTALVDEFKSDPVIRVQCMLAVAQAEAALVGIPKEGKVPDPFDLKPLAPGDSRGDPAKAIEWLDKAAEAAGDIPWGKDAKKLADALRNQNTKEQIATLQTSLFDISATPAGKWPAGVPKDKAHGWPGP